ncbi:hypothetical protein GCM10023205_71990 [Yinghuangia aomiensis]|uniref:Uncharacterized protein n=1 Tax=Yinghuangia aomiensis TaxID=676205 RepID=A0ABP9I7B3_9ACTN
MTDERAIWARFCDDIRSAGDLLIADAHPRPVRRVVPVAEALR